MEALYIVTFISLAISCAFLEYRRPAEAQGSYKEGFKSFRNGYILVYCLMMGKGGGGQNWGVKEASGVMCLFGGPSGNVWVTW